MKIVFTSLMLVAALIIAGCGPQKAADSKAAIEQSKTLQSVEQQVNYLVKQANAFVRSKEYDQAIRTAQYVLSNLDRESAQAKKILEDAKVKLQEAAQAAVKDAKSALGGLGK